jgi:hypothetical protein
MTQQTPALLSERKANEALCDWLRARTGEVYFVTTIHLHVGPMVPGQGKYLPWFTRSLDSVRLVEMALNEREQRDYVLTLSGVARGITPDDCGCCEEWEEADLVAVCLADAPTRCAALVKAIGLEKTE